MAFLQQILCRKNERPQGKRRVLGSKMKYWMENIWKKHEHFLVRTAERENNKRCRRIFLRYSFLVQIGKLIQVIKITRSNRDKSPYNVHTKDKTGVLTCGQFKSVNNHSERRAKAEAVISHKSIALVSRYKSVGALIYFH